MEYGYISQWMDKAIRSKVGDEMAYLGFRKYEYLDIRIVDKLDSIRKVMVVLKHRTEKKNDIHEYNVTVLSFLTYADWTISSGEVMARCIYSDNGFWKPFDVVADWVIDYMGDVQKKLRGEE